jgi:hypothetical protein
MNTNGRSACTRSSSTLARKDGYAKNRDGRHKLLKKTLLLLPYGADGIGVVSIRPPDDAARLPEINEVTVSP